MRSIINRSDTEGFVKLDTVLIPPKEASDLAVSISKTLSEKYDTEFVLDCINLHPHITLYSPEYPRKGLGNIISSLGDIARDTQRIKLETKSISVGEESIVVNFRLSPQIGDLHKQVVDRLNVIRDGRIPDKYKNTDSLPADQKENMLKYGVRTVMKLYNPHITIATIEDRSQLKQALSDVKWGIKEFTSDRMGLYETGENGTCKKLLKLFKLGEI